MMQRKTLASEEVSYSNDAAAVRLQRLFHRLKLVAQRIPAARSLYFRRTPARLGRTGPIRSSVFAENATDK